MPDLLQMIGDGEESGSRSTLEELRVGENAALLILFTRDADEVLLHFESDPAVNRYVVCPGSGCPACYAGSVPKAFALLPVYSIERRAVAVLRVSMKVEAHSLIAGIRPLLEDQDISNKLVVVRRNGQKCLVEEKPLPKNADRGERVIKRFLTARENGLKLASAFPQPTLAEYAQVERIRRLLEPLGGLPDSTSPARPDLAGEEPE